MSESSRVLVPEGEGRGLASSTMYPSQTATSGSCARLGEPPWGLGASDRPLRKGFRGVHTDAVRCASEGRPGSVFQNAGRDNRSAILRRRSLGCVRLPGFVDNLVRGRLGSHDPKESVVMARFAILAGLRRFGR